MFFGYLCFPVNHYALYENENSTKKIIHEFYCLKFLQSSLQLLHSEQALASASKGFSQAV
jgi:hypothetical protein